MSSDTEVTLSVRQVGLYGVWCLVICSITPSAGVGEHEGCANYVLHQPHSG